METLGALKFDDSVYGKNFQNDGQSFHQREQTVKTLMLLKDSSYLKADEGRLQITKLGKAMLEYPIGVRCAKMIILGNQGNCLPYVIGVVSILSIESLQFSADEIDNILSKKLEKINEKKNEIKQKFRNINKQNEDNNNNKSKKQLENEKQMALNVEKEKEVALRKNQRKIVIKMRNEFANRKSDILSYLNILGAYECSRNKSEFCANYFIRSKNINECHNLVMQLKSIIQRLLNKTNSESINSFSNRNNNNMPKEDEDDSDWSDDENNSNNRNKNQHRNRNRNRIDLSFGEPPNGTQEILLRQIIATGLIDHVARKWPNNHLPSFTDSDGRDVSQDWIHSARNLSLLKKAYQTMSNPNEPVFIHPTSYIYCKSGNVEGVQSQPEFIVYYSLYRTQRIINKQANNNNKKNSKNKSKLKNILDKDDYEEQEEKSSKDNNSNEIEKIESRVYMRHVTIIETHWLPRIAPHMCIVSEPLEKPKPFYDKINDCIKCWVECRFGPMQWELPRMAVEFSNNNNSSNKNDIKNQRKYKWFARYLMEGEVFEDLVVIRPYLKYRPYILTNESIINTNKNVVALTDKLIEHDICCKDDLTTMWMHDKNFLLDEMKAWVYEIKQYLLKKCWPPKK